MIWINKGVVFVPLDEQLALPFGTTGVEIEENGARRAKGDRADHGPGGVEGKQREQRACYRADTETECARERRRGPGHVGELIQNHRHGIRRHHRNTADERGDTQYQRPKAEVKLRADHHPHCHHELDEQPGAKHA